MNRETYTPLALATALPTALDMRYLGPGLVAELGEIYGVQAKAVRDDWTPEERAEKLRAETGDVAWFLAVIISTLSDYHAPEIDYDRDIPAGTPALAYLLALASRIDVLTAQASNPLGHALAEPLARNAWDILAAHSSDWTGVPFAQVLRGNVIKLAGRAAKNTIMGSGDNR